MKTLHILSAGAAKALVQQLQGEFEAADPGLKVAAKFGAVGAMKEALLAGEPCDVFIVTQAMLQELIQAGRLEGSQQAALGKVLTGLAVPSNQAQGAIDSPEQLARFLSDASAIYFPDPLRATAGIHFAKVMEQMGIKAAVQARFKTYPNGAAAMADLAKDTSGSAAGCTQVSEILYTPGVRLVGPLPQAFELSTSYAGTISASAQSDAAQRVLASKFIATLCAASRVNLRLQAGFI
jgi:molybdate transport system substrate-binding protein